MPYEDFSIEKIQDEFSIAIRDVPNLFDVARPMEPSERLRSLLQEFAPLGSSIGTEKARSEFIIAPILAEIKKTAGDGIGLFSGNRFDVDKEKGLTGYCDFLFSLSSSQMTISAPILAIVEAKNENINSGFGQCMAEMLAAGIYNRARQRPIKTIHGCVTTGSVWRFLRLEDDTISLDGVEYYLDQLSKILGILMAMLRQS
uniref:Uncharacterized protein n=1 Tax=Candidatus Kentrum sp. UNK TaxID=2126344 RepID=A0A451AKC0_9GAMM|nr:MAG: hypothetical protein BECKUNK1418G_GA0071005_10952 [Candidatus Kentron sp. UNK]VFK71680.1 MAG: hypothetical protein BECKUNK1418H_GA0071006_10785 [Candidatus Kentron sp. UNK]